MQGQARNDGWRDELRQPPEFSCPQTISKSITHAYKYIPQCHCRTDTHSGAETNMLHPQRNCKLKPHFKLPNSNSNSNFKTSNSKLPNLLPYRCIAPRCIALATKVGDVASYSPSPERYAIASRCTDDGGTRIILLGHITIFPSPLQKKRIQHDETIINQQTPHISHACANSSPQSLTLLGSHPNGGE